MISLPTDQLRDLTASAGFWFDHHGAAVLPQDGDRFCMFAFIEQHDGTERVQDGSIVEYVGDGLVVPDNRLDEDKGDYRAGSRDFEDFAIRQNY